MNYFISDIKSMCKNKIVLIDVETSIVFKVKAISMLGYIDRPYTICYFKNNSVKGCDEDGGLSFFQRAGKSPGLRNIRSGHRVRMVEAGRRAYRIPITSEPGREPQ